MHRYALFLLLLVCAGCSTRPSESDFKQFDATTCIDYLDSEKSVLRLRAAKRLTEIGEQSENVLTRILDGVGNEPNPAIREEYARCLAMVVHSRHDNKLANREIDNRIIAKLDYLLKFDDDPDVRATAGVYYGLLTHFDLDDPNAIFVAGSVFDAIERDRKRTILFYVAVFVSGILFVPLAAFVFSGGTLALGIVWPDFAVSGPDGWNFRDFYFRFLIVAAVFTFLCLPIVMLAIPLSGWIAFGILAATFHFVFDAGWLHATVIGGGGGFISVLLFVQLLNSISLP